MKKYLTILLLIVINPYTYGQVIDSIQSNKDIKKSILNTIEVNLEAKTAKNESKLIELSDIVKQLDIDIENTRSSYTKSEKLTERLKVVEDQYKTIKKNELDIYQANYQSAVINLLFMEQDIKPLKLFNSTKSFFTSLSETSNPMSYKGYKKWYKTYYTFIENKKEKQYKLNALSNLITITGDLTKGVPFTGPLANSFLDGITSFISSFRRKDKQLIKNSQEMFLLTSKVIQFAHDNQKIELEWNSITKELEELEKHYSNILTENLNFLSIDTSNFNIQYKKQKNGNIKLQFLKDVEQKAGDAVVEQKTKDSKKWKSLVYYQMNDVKSLKIRFGRLTFRISENLNQYKVLIDKYKNDSDIGIKVKELDKQLISLKKTFDEEFESIEYLNSTTKMYRID
jgi:hypothetical protein